MHHQIDALAYTNQLRSLPPEHKLGFAIALFGLGYVAPMPVQGLIILWLSLWVVKYAQIPAQVYGKLLLVPTSFLLMSVPAFLVGVSGAGAIAQPDAVVGVSVGAVYVYLSQQGWEQLCPVFVRAIALTSCLYFILLTIPFAELLRILHKLGCPAILTELMTLMYRFIFVLTQTASELVTAQHARLGYGTWRLGINSLSVLIGQLLSRTLENYRQLCLGLAARGYGGDVQLWHSRHYRPNRRYTAEAIGGYVVLLTLTGLHYRALL